jgi:beta-glucosidase
MKIIHFILFLFFMSFSLHAQQKTVSSISASVNQSQAALAFDGNSTTGWNLGANDLKFEQSLMLTLQTSGDIKGLQIEATGISAKEIQQLVNIFVTYDPMNPGEAAKFSLSGNKVYSLVFPPKYGAFIKIVFKGNIQSKPFTINEISVLYEKEAIKAQAVVGEQAWRNTQLPLEERVELLLSAMTIKDKMELLRESWGIAGLPHLGVPEIRKVEALHGFSYGSGATIFPQSIAMGATWNKKLIEEVAAIIADESLSAGAIQAWSPVLDVAQDARWGRCEETYGEDPVLVSEIGGAWIKGFQSKGLLTTPKHFAVHGATLGGRDSHDIGLSEREIREIHLGPFRHVIKDWQS